MRSAALQQVIDAVPADFADADDDYRAVRAKMAPFHGHPVSDDVRVREERLGDVDVQWLWCGPEEPARTLLFCHGGGFVSCDATAYQFYAEIIARQLNARVAIVDYRLAPEHPFPAALEDCCAAYAALYAGGIRPAVIGDSCGGGLAVAVAQRFAPQGRAPGAVISLCGWLNLQPADSAPEPFISAGWLRARARDYLGDVAADDPRASPIYAAVDGLPPVLLQVGETDVTRPDAERLAARIEAEGGTVVLDVVEGAVHGFQGLVDLPEAQRAWDRCRAFVDLFEV